MITKQEWIDFLDKHYRALDIDKDDDIAAFIMLATVETFLRTKGEIE